MSEKINRHVFHGAYSNFGYRPSFSTDRRLANYPIHYFRASFAEKENSGDESPKEFQTEEEVLRWYKKNKYGESEFDKLEFPKDFCKNYFIIPESEFYKYMGLFHRTIKGLKITSDIEIESEGTAFSASCPETKSESGDDGFPGEGECNPSTATVTFQSPNGEACYFTLEGGADDVGFLNGKQISDGQLGDASGAAGPFNQELIPKTKERTLTVEGKNNPFYCGPYGISATVTWYPQIDYKQKIKININFDSTKIFSFSEIQKRLGAHDMEYHTTVDLKENKNKEELISEIDKKVYKDEWKFDQTQFKEIFQQQANKFNFNATFINDPVILSGAESYGSGSGLNVSPSLSIINKHQFNGGGDGLTAEIVNKQKNFEKNFEKFGSIQYKIENNNSIINDGEQFINFYISKLFYIRSKKIYLCFVEMHHSIPLDGSVVDLQKNCNDQEEPSTSTANNLSILGPESNTMVSVLKMLDDSDIVKLLKTENYSKVAVTNPLNIEYVFTTRDNINIEPPKYKTSECAEEEKELEFEKTKCDLKLGNKTFQIEIFKLKESQFVFNNENCEDLTPAFKRLIKNTLKINSVKKPTFEILEWKSTDIDKNNTFPSKLV